MRAWWLCWLAVVNRHQLTAYGKYDLRGKGGRDRALAPDGSHVPEIEF